MHFFNESQGKEFLEYSKTDSGECYKESESSVNNLLDRAMQIQVQKCNLQWNKK